MILVVSPYNLPKPRSDLSRTMMLPELKLGLDGFELRDHPLLRRNPPDNEWSGGGFATEMGETQKREGFRFPFTTPLSSSRSEPPELDQSCFVRMQFQTDAPTENFFPNGRSTSSPPSCW